MKVVWEFPEYATEEWHDIESMHRLAAAREHFPSVMERIDKSFEIVEVQQ